MSVQFSQDWLQQCATVAEPASGGGRAATSLGGPTHEAVTFDGLARPLLAAWAAAPAFCVPRQRLPAPPPAEDLLETHPAQSPQRAEAPPHGAGGAADVAAALRRGAALLAAQWQQLHPQLGNLLVRLTVCIFAVDFYYASNA